MFPIGELTKPEVRAIATKQDLVTADKKDSQGLCFIGKVRLPDFLQQQLQPKEGQIIEIPESFESYSRSQPTFQSLQEELAFRAMKTKYVHSDGTVVGTHQGAHYFTKGQRKGLAVGGTVEPLFVIDTDVVDNIIYTGQGKSHPGLYKSVLLVQASEAHWVRPDLAIDLGGSLKVTARIRYRQELETACLYATSDGLYVAFDSPQSAITEGQFVAWYLGDELVGSGVIS